MFVLGYGTAALLLASSFSGWWAENYLYIAAVLLAISAFAQWFFSRRSSKA